jgi:hypothetical protein
MFLFEFGLRFVLCRNPEKTTGKRGDLRQFKNLSAGLFEEMLKMHCHLLS